eukprot:Nitzschia sp. Nitz4//scaffold11_size288233//82144//83578//NITZ4_000752-RA/size288233-snap-gene-0.11-mRNA-1//1//CDS//3329534008//2354//frame0
MTIPLYPDIIYEGDLSPDAVGDDIKEKVEKIDAACKGWGTDELRLIKALAYCTPEERVKVAVTYEQEYGKTLKKEMKSECGKGDFGTALQFLAVPSDEAECDMIKKACKGAGTDELLLYPIICGRSNQEIDILKKKFYSMYSEDLGVYLTKELGGDFEKLVVNCLQGIEEEFDPDYHTDELVEADVEAFFQMGEGKWGTDEEGLFKLLCSRPYEHLEAVNSAYADKHDVTLFKVMDTELGGHTRDATLYLLGMKIKPYQTVAKLIKKACKGIGTNELLLTCAIIRYQICLSDVMDAYEELYGESLQELLKSEIGGDYRRLLTELCDAAIA